MSRSIWRARCHARGCIDKRHEYRAQKSTREGEGERGGGEEEERVPFVYVKKGFAVDIAAYITHVIDDGDSSGSLQPVISCPD